MLINPPMVLRPNSVPWGPRSTSALARSILRSSEPALAPMKIPSATTPTAGSKFFSTSATPMPRIKIAATPPGPCPVSSIMRLGEILARSMRSRAKVRSISVWLIALTAKPTSCRLSVCFRAVTTISSRPPSCALMSGAAIIALTALVATATAVARAFFLTCGCIVLFIIIPLG